MVALAILAVSKDVFLKPARGRYLTMIQQAIIARREIPNMAFKALKAGLSGCFQESSPHKVNYFGQSSALRRVNASADAQLRRSPQTGAGMPTGGRQVEAKEGSASPALTYPRVVYCKMVVIIILCAET